MNLKSGKRREFLYSLSSLIIGIVLGQYIPPLISWKIEDWRKQREYRIALIRQWRNNIESIPDEQWDQMGLPCGDTAWYSSLRLHMNKEVIHSVEYDLDNRILIVGYCRKGYPKKQILLDEVARLEKKWGLN